MKKMMLMLVPALLCSSGAFAASPMKPGLWEMTMKSDMMKNMPKISPEQIEQMRKMGIEVPQMSDGGIVTKVCITKEMTERDEVPEMNNKELGCEGKNYQRSGSTYSLDLVCEGPQMKGVGKVKGSYPGNDRFSSIYDFKGTAHGQPINQQHETNGKWVNADCGNVAPMGAAPRKK